MAQINPQQAVTYVWMEILNYSPGAGVLRPLVEKVYDVGSCGPAGIALGPNQHLLLGCAQQPSVVINAKTGAIVATIPQVGGSDEVWFNPGDNRYYLAARNNPGGPVLGLPAAPAWLADSRAVLVSKAHDVRSFHGAVMRLGLDGSTRPLFWSLNVGPTVAIAGPGTVVFDAAAVRSNLFEHALDGGEGAWLTRGHALDRQPRYSPDGRSLLFSSNRGGNLG